MRKVLGQKFAIVLLTIMLVFFVAAFVIMVLTFGSKDQKTMQLFSSVDEVDSFIQSQEYDILEELNFSETISVEGYYGNIISVRNSKVKVKAYTFIDKTNSKEFCTKYVKHYNTNRPFGCIDIVFNVFEKTKIIWFDEGSLIGLEAVSKFDHEVLNELFYKMQMVFSRNMITE